MNYTDIVALAKAGFTAQQIAQMAVAPEPTPAPASTPTPAPEPTPTPAPTPTPVPEDQLTAILAEMATLRQTVQAQALQNAELIPPKAQTAQDVLASIIAPPPKDGGNK